MKKKGYMNIEREKEKDATDGQRKEQREKNK